MSTMVMTTHAQRVGVLKGEILKHVGIVEVFGRFGVKKKIPKNSGDTVKYRRWLPYGGTTNTPNTWAVTPATHQLNEGETPVGDVLTPQDITVQLQEYGFAYRWSNRVEELYEDDVPSEIRDIAKDRAALLMEMIRWGELRAGTNVYRAANAASRALVNGRISAGLMRNITRNMQSNQAMEITKILSASDGFDTSAIEAGFIAVAHTDLQTDLRTNLAGYVVCAEYGTRQMIHPKEHGAFETIRFILSPHLTPYLAAGTTTTANTVLSNGVPNSAGSELADVYPIVVLSQEAFGDVGLRGMESMKVGFEPAGKSVKGDILGQRGEMGMRAYSACVRLNEFHMAVAEVAVGVQAN
jgi:N4-gp56 family major capsid protein